MRSWKTLAFVLAAIPLVSEPVGAGEDADLGRQLRSAAQPLLSPAPGDAGGVGSLIAILGIASRVAQQADLPKGVAAKLGEAHAAWRKNTKAMPDRGVEAALGEAYAALHGGRRFAFPQEVRTIEQAREVCRREIDGAVAALEAGRRGEATRGMLEFVMLVTTPMEAH